MKGLLDFSRQSPPKISLVDIHQTIERTLAVAANQLALSHVILVKEFCEDAPRVKADENQMQQVFLNLIVNAIDAIGPDGGTLTIGSHLGVKDTQPCLEVTVKDTGCGIPAENLNKIFEPFYSTKDQRGTGLGLSIIWGILDNHHGRITVQITPSRIGDRPVINPLRVGEQTGNA